MKILMILSPKTGAIRSDMEKLALPEEKAVWALYKAGAIREMYFQPDPVRVVFVWEAPSKQEVQEKIASFPMIEAGLLEAEFLELNPWAQLEVLFAH